MAEPAKGLYDLADMHALYTLGLGAVEIENIQLPVRPLPLRIFIIRAVL